MISYIEEPIKYHDKMNQLKIQCSCGHKVVMPFGTEKKICSWCGNYVYRNEKAEFTEKLKNALKKCSKK